MASLPAPRPPLHPNTPAAEVHGTARWVDRPRATPDTPARRGRLSINGVVYLVDELLDDAQCPVGWLLTRPAVGRTDAASYAVDTAQAGPAPTPAECLCSCPDADFRPRPGGCKHARALCAALAYLRWEEEMAAQRAASGESDYDVWSRGLPPVDPPAA